MPQTMVSVEANLARGMAAITLRDEGFDGRVILIGAEPHLPDERPPLSKKYLQGEKLLAEITLRPLASLREGRQ